MDTNKVYRYHCNSTGVEDTHLTDQNTINVIPCKACKNDRDRLKYRQQMQAIDLSNTVVKPTTESLVFDPVSGILELGRITITEELFYAKENELFKARDDLYQKQKHINSLTGMLKTADFSLDQLELENESMFKFLIEILYLKYREDSILESLNLNTSEKIKNNTVYANIRTLVDKYYTYYKGLSKKDFCTKFESVTNYKGEEDVQEKEDEDELNY
jgi:hypothetical protein